jgi:hypothetical protein
MESNRTRMLSESEVAEVRGLAAAIRTIKERNYDAITWEKAIDQVVREKTTSDAEYFRKTALLDYFLNESQQLSSLSIFLEGLDENILNRQQRAAGYAITDTERVELRQKIERRLIDLGDPADERAAFEYYQLLIDKVFTSATIDDLFSSLAELSSVLKRFFPQAFPEASMLVAHASNLDAIIRATSGGATKKHISAEIGIDVDAVGLLMHRLTQIGVFTVSKRGRQNEYFFKGTALDVNALRREWGWLWSSPYKRLTLRLYEHTKSCRGEA